MASLPSPVPAVGSLPGAATGFAEGLVASDAEVRAAYQHPHLSRWAAVTTQSAGAGRASDRGRQCLTHAADGHPGLPVVPAAPRPVRRARPGAPGHRQFRRAFRPAPRRRSPPGQGAGPGRHGRLARRAVRPGRLAVRPGQGDLRDRSSVMAASPGRADPATGLCETVAWQIGTQPARAVEGNVRSSGATLSWLAQLTSASPAKLASIAADAGASAARHEVRYRVQAT